MTILLVEQYVEFALRLAQRYAVMDAGPHRAAGDVATADTAMFAASSRSDAAIISPMRLTPHEQERLLVHVAADVARARRARGLRLNHPEAVAMLTSWVLEAARDGRTVVDLMEAGRHVLARDDVMDGRARDDRRGAGRGDVPRRHQARHAARADPDDRECLVPGEIAGDGGRSRSTPAGR